MAFTKKTIRDINLADKTVLVRVDYNVPVSADGSIGDLFRVEASLPTLKYLLDQNCKLVLISHLGRPEGKVDPKLSLKPVAPKLAELIGRPVQFIDDCVGEKVEQAAASLRSGEIILLENLRFHPEEEANNPDFAKKLAGLGGAFVQDGFAVVHRAHASTSAITKFLPSVAGLLLAKEVDTITEAMESPKRPLVAILGGAKVSDKIELIERLVNTADTLVIGGAMANTFFSQMGYAIGKSIYEPAAVSEAARLLALTKTKQCQLYFPTKDVACGKALDPKTARQEKKLGSVEPDDYILDLGQESMDEISQIISKAGTVIWNGPLGMTEYQQFKEGSLSVAENIIKSGAFGLIGGGDTAAFLDTSGFIRKFDWVSTGGGASLELMAGKKLPGVEALLDK